MRWNPKSWILIGVLLTVMTMTGVAQVATTQVADTVYHADGTVAMGTVLISWPAFTTSNGDSIPSGSTSAVIAGGGALSVQLIPNTGSTPIGSYYTAVFHLDDGSVSREYWVVPVSIASVKISTIESTVLPTTVAMQTVSKSYVDTAIAAAVTGHPLDSTPYVLKAGDTMAGPLVLPADPVSATQAADKNYVDESVASLTGGLGQMVSTLPSATQVVAQPTGTQLEVNSLNGVEYASQFVNGRGNNGIANVLASPDCTNGCEVEAEQDYTNESYSAASFNNQTHLKDARGGRQVDSYKNPLDVVHNGLSTAQTIDDVSTQSELSLHQQTGSPLPGSMAVVITQEGLAGGSNLFPEQIESSGPYFKMGYSALTVNGTYNTQGQHVLVPEESDCFGVGDCLIGARTLYASGGFRDSADEGAHLYDLQAHEDPRVFAGTCTSGCATGSTTVMIAQNSGGGTQGDGRFLIDTNPAKTITSASTGGAIVGGTSGGAHATAQFSGTNLPVSVFLSTGQVIPSQANNMAPGVVTIAIATSGMPTGYAANTTAIGASSGLACVVDQTAGYAPHNYEMAPYIVVDATHLQMTLNKPHQIMATLAFGGLCGYGLEQTVDTASGIRQLFPVVGAYSATGLYYAGGVTAVVGLMYNTSAFLNMSASIASATRNGNVVTVTTNGNIININGLSVTIAGVADSSYNGNYVVTTTGTNSFTYAQTGANSSSTGGTASILTGGFALYPMAEVLSVFDQATSSVDGQMTLAPNNVAWAANDPVEEPHYYEENVSADTELVGQSVPRPTTTEQAGIQYQQNNGPGLTGWMIDNSAPAQNYLGYGGTHSVPDGAYKATGIWRRTMNLTAGEQAVFAIHCNLHGCGNWNSGYNLFELDSSVSADLVAYSPTASALSLIMRGTPYSFSPLAFTAGTINVGTLNATTINGTVNGTSVNAGTVAAAYLPLFGPSGTAHASGIVPDPGATAGSARFLREDGTWVAPSGGGSGTVTTVTGTAPVVSSGGTTPAISMPAATASVDGYLSSTDWNTFNSKQAALSYTPAHSGTNSDITSLSGLTTALSPAQGGTGGDGIGYAYGNGGSAFTYSTTIPNSGLENSSTTVNGQTCTLGSPCTVTAAATSLAVGTTTITSGTSGDIEYDNGGVLGEKGVTGTGSVVLASSPSIASPTITSSFTATGLVTNTDLANSTISGVSLGSNLDPLTFGTHLVAGGSSYNGGANVTITSDATSADTVSTIVARDSSGNFSAGAITASLNGTASAATNIAGGAAYTVPYQSAAGTTAMLTSPTVAGTYALVEVATGSAVAPTFTNAPALSAANMTSFPSSLASLANPQFSGQIGLNATPYGFDLFEIGGTSPLTNTSLAALDARFTTNSSETNTVTGIQSIPTTAASTSLSTLDGFNSTFTLGAGGSVGTYIGYQDVKASTHTATNNASLADNHSFSGNYFLNQSGADPSQLANAIFTHAAPTSAASQVSFGGTVDAPGANNCPATGVTGCLVINVSGTLRDVPYY